MDKLVGLIADPDLGGRYRLRQVLAALPEFGTVFQAQTLPVAEGIIKERLEIDLVFVADRFGTSTVSSWLGSLRTCSHGSEVALLLVAEESAVRCSDMRTQLLHGADGFLVEPFSAEAARDVAALAWRVKRERRLEKQRVALRLLLKELSGVLDSIAELKHGGAEARISMENLRHMGSELAHLDPELQAFFIEECMAYFPEVACPVRREKPSYRGASQRVKKMVEERIQKLSAEKKRAG